jgi:hypothetical protein
MKCDIAAYRQATALLRAALDNSTQNTGNHCMSDQDQADIRLAVARLKQEHLDFDAAIQAMIQVGCDQLRIQRMKKKKLIIKDKLIELEDKIIPDIIA